MERTISLQETLFGLPITCTATVLDGGLHVLLTGGCRTHTGAVSLCRPKEAPTTISFPGHKEQIISESWAKFLADALEKEVCVVCGIHYDSATGDEIQEILRKTELMSKALLKALILI